MVESHKFCVMCISSLSGIVFYSDTKGGTCQGTVKSIFCSVTVTTQVNLGIK